MSDCGFFVGRAACTRDTLTESHAVEAELIDGFGDLFATIVGVEQRSLKLVSSIEEQAAVQDRSALIDDFADAGVTSITTSSGIGAVGSRRAELVQVRVDVIDVEERLVPVAFCINIPLLMSLGI